MSLAIAGDRRGAEALLAPLIEKQDRAAWRTRTFAMAVTGGSDEAVAIAYASMPQDLAAGIAPYLRYMPRLTPAQQAAAANFGRFPRAADIGRDDPRVVQYAALNPRAPRQAEAGLIPSGAPLGPSAASTEKPSREKRRRPGRIETAAAPASTRPATMTAQPTPIPSQTYASASASPAPATTPPVVPRPTVLSALDVPPGSARPAVPPIRPAQPPASRPPAPPTATPPPTTTIVSSSSAVAKPGFQQDLTAPPPEARAPVQVAAAASAPPKPASLPAQPSTQPQPSQTSSAAPRPTLGTAGSFDLAKVGSTTATQNAPAPAPTPAPPPVTTSAPPSQPVTQAAASTPTPPARTASAPAAVTKACCAFC